MRMVDPLLLDTEYMKLSDAHVSKQASRHFYAAPKITTLSVDT